MAEAADAEAEVAVEEVEGTTCVLLSRYMNGNPCTSNPVTPATTTATTQLRLRAILLMAMAMLMLMLLGQWMVLLLPLPLLFTKPPTIWSAVLSHASFVAHFCPMV